MDKKNFLKLLSLTIKLTQYSSELFDTYAPLYDSAFQQTPDSLPVVGIYVLQIPFEALTCEIVFSAYLEGSGFHARVGRSSSSVQEVYRKYVTTCYIFVRVFGLTVPVSRLGTQLYVLYVY